MINFFNQKNVLYFILLVILFLFYSYFSHIILKAANFDPFKSNAFSIGSIYIGYTNYTFFKTLTIITGIIFSNLLEFKNL